MSDHHRLLVHFYNQAVSKYVKYKERLDKAMRSGRFNGLDQREKSKLIHRLRRLKLKVEAFQLKLKVAVAAGALALTLTALEPVQAQTNLGPFVQQKRSANPLRGAFNTAIDQAPVSVDFDLDGDFDVVVGFADSLVFYKNNGTVTSPKFDALTGPWISATGEGYPFPWNSFASGDGTVSPAFADLDDDGDSDLILGTNGNGFRYFRRETDGSYAEQTGPWNPSATPPSGNPLNNFADGATAVNGGFDFSPTFADYDNDGDLDVVFGHAYDWVSGGADFIQIHVIKNRKNITGFNEFETFIETTSPFDLIKVAATGYEAKPRFVDTDGSGDLDLFVGTEFGEIRFFRSSVNGSWAQQTGPWNPTTKAGNPLNLFTFGSNASIDFVDLDGDTDMDALVFGNNGSFKYEASHIRYLRNDGNFVFTELEGPANPFDGIPAITDNGSQGAIYPAFIDYDLDSHPDVWVTDYFSPVSTTADEASVTLYRNNQTTDQFEFSSSFNTSTVAENFPIEVNFDGTGGDDLILTNTDGTILFYRNDGGGTFTFEPTNDLNTKVAATSPIGLAFVDWNSDGLPDAFVGRGTSVEYYQNDGIPGPPTFTQVTGASNPMDGVTITALSFITSADTNNDGFTDLFVSSPTATVRLFVNQGNSSFVEYTAPDRPFNGATTATIGALPAPKMLDIDQDGDKDIFVGNSIAPVGMRGIQFFENTNEPPVVVPGGSTYSYTAGGPGVTISTSLELNDDNDGALSAQDLDVAHAKIQITGNYVNGQDLLSFTPVGNITSFFDAASGTLNLVGFDTMSNYETALQSVKYTNSSSTPSTATRTITWYVFDHDATDPRLDATADATVQVNVVINTPPSANLGTTGITYTGSSIALASSLTVTDTDDTNLESATISVSSGFVNGEDVLSFTNQLGITGTYNATTGVLTLTGTSSVANYQTALRTITYFNNFSSPVAANRQVSFVVNDGTANSAPQTLTVNYPGANVAPSLSTTTANVSFSGAVVTLDNALTVTDPENSIASASIQIGTGYVSGEDVLLFTNQSGITGSFDAATGILSLTGVTTVGNYQTALRSVQYNNIAANRTNANRTISISVNDGSANSNAISITLSVPNQAPVVALATTSASYAGTDLSLDNTLTITDSDDGDIASATVSFSTGYVFGEDVLLFSNQNGISGSYDAATGVLSLTGASSKTNYEVALRSVAYRNTASSRTNTNRAVAYQVNDGTANSNVATLQLLIPNVAPTLALSTSSANYSGTDLVLDNGITLADADDLTLQSAVVQVQNGYVASEDVLVFTNQSGITGNFDATTGTLTLSGVSSVINYQNALRTVTYSNVSPNRTAGIRNVSFNVNDGQSGSTTPVIALTVVNTAPTIASSNNSAFYLSGDLVINNALTVADADNTQLNSAAVSITGGFVSAEDQLLFASQNGITGSFSSSTGVLTLTGLSSVVNYQAALRSVQYRNTSSAPSAANRVIAFLVNDGANASNSLTVALGINQAPVVSAQPQTTGAGGNVSLDVASILSDADNNLDLSTLQITSREGADITISSGQVVIDYSSVADFQGTDVLTIVVCDVAGRCSTQTVNIEVTAGIIVFNGVSPNGDNANDFFKIRFLPPGSRVRIYNRWGDLVFDMPDYDNSNSSKRFDGLNSNGNELTSGTYFYKIETPQGKTLTGYLALKR